VLELCKGVVLNERAHLLSETDFLRNMTPNFELLSAQVLECKKEFA
jgi:hypothetical protein